LFARKDFIAASRDFVCIRIETYESKDSEAMVRELLKGAFANTSFCIFDPQGKRRLSRSGRGPTSLVGRGRNRDGDGGSSDDAIIKSMQRIAANYERNGGSEDTVLQKFHSFRQALNVASADQRLLVMVDAEEKDREVLDGALRRVFAQPEVIGRFHLAFTDPTGKEDWKEKVKGNTTGKGIYVIRSSQFGLDGVVMEKLAVSSDADSIRSALLESNVTFAKIEDRKVYREHVMAGRRERIYFENEIPYGEDRDGDGKIDKVKGRSRR
jgi:hypothetical protein